MPFFNIIAETNEATVVTEYKPIASNSALYQSEAELEKEFIKLLQNQGYEYLNIHKEEDLIVNLRRQLELLNNISFTEDEWDKLFKQKICNQNYGIVEKTRIIQEDYRVVLERDNGTIVNKGTQTTANGRITTNNSNNLVIDITNPSVTYVAGSDGSANSALQLSNTREGGNHFSISNISEITGDFTISMKIY